MDLFLIKHIIIENIVFSLNEERLGKLTESYIVSNHKIKAALGIAKMPVSAREGFFKTFNSFNKK